MVQQADKKEQSVLRNIDWWTVLIYIALLSFGWISVCGASYSYGETDIFSLSTRSGMQIVWIVTSIMLGLFILLLDARFYDTFAFVIFGLLLLLLFATIFNPHSIKGSRSWLVLGPLRLQPAEFAKFATALAQAKLMSAYGYDIRQWRHFAAALLVILLPMVCIVLQRETGSALVYLAFFLMFYREGMPGSILFTGVAMVVYFVVGIRYAEVFIGGSTASLGEFAVLLLVQLFSIGMVWVYCNHRVAVRILLLCVGVTLLSYLLSLIPFLSILTSYLVYVQIGLLVVLLGWLVWEGLGSRLRNYYFIALFAVGSAGFYYGADFIMQNVMEPHQRSRINVLLGLDEDLRGAGYNVHQSEIAIGSGGLEGKGFLNGTQTKLKFVPEQDTDFIFCTVGEEEGFLGSAGVLLLFLALILRLIWLSERQPSTFGRVYGYSVLSIFLFHVFINVGMVLGLTPVIGIPLPFFSYGGSSLWGFTFLLFIFLRLDASRHLRI
ncbi:MAG: rod shape-determining protein RodA [Prevotella sp.]|nr:rod shape-determining protein RodA [Prevotella sp.]